jgi:hypothetical protein
MLTAAPGIVVCDRCPAVATMVVRVVRTVYEGRDVEQALPAGWVEDQKGRHRCPTCAEVPLASR